ncbi:MAG: hypothetical protein JST00_37525 [Deltaproteobacteria bacterium]|nr:hypothetical protein [Deltaproteobacteria bacterium]
MTWKKRALLLVLVTVAVSLGPRAANAQLLLADRSGAEHRVLVSVGWESTWNVRIGYAAAISRAIPANIDVTWTTPIAVFDPTRGGRLEAGLNTLVGQTRGLAAATSLRSGVAWSSDPLGARVSWTGAALIAPGWYDDTWHLAAELGWRAALVTFMRHSDVVRGLYGDRIGAPAGEGANLPSVFGLTSQRFDLGLRGGWARAKGVGIVARAGLDLSPQVQGIVGVAPIYPLPFYADLGGDYRW